MKAWMVILGLLAILAVVVVWFAGNAISSLKGVCVWVVFLVFFFFCVFVFFFWFFFFFFVVFFFLLFFLVLLVVSFR